MWNNKKIVDGCTATTYVAYALSEVATIYPITAVASMGEIADRWGIAGRPNLWGQRMIVRELQSEKGAAGATHGCLSGGTLATTFTASQGLLLMIPNMYKIAGELLPGVFHIGTRSIATHALSIFNDHSDVMACRQTGFAMLASASVQECMDMALVAHLSAISGSIPFLHFFDGWRTSSEMHRIEMISYSDMAKLVNWKGIQDFRDRAMNPEHPNIRGTAQGSQVFFQYREASNALYSLLPLIVEDNMKKIETLTGRSYHLFDYLGAPDAEYVIVSIGSSCEVTEETVQYLNKIGYKVGCIKVRLYRPFSAKHFLAAIPSTTKLICALDRTKEPGSQGEPLFQDICTALHMAGNNLPVIGGRYGLSSKEFTPSMVKAIFDYMKTPDHKPIFTVGINDNLSNLSIPVGEDFDICAPGTVECKFYGFGSDGTVGGSKQAANIIGDHTDLDIQAYFKYGPKKSGNYTISELRFGKEPIKSVYEIISPDIIQCHKDVYVNRFDVLKGIKPKGTFVLNSSWTLEDMEHKLPAKIRRTIAQKQLKFYNIDANKIATEVGLGVRINMIMETVFFRLINVIPFDDAVKYLKEAIQEIYLHEAGAVVKMNFEAVDKAADALVEINYPDSWKDAVDEPPIEENIPWFVRDIVRPILSLKGDILPVSRFSPNGFFPVGTAAYEKRNVAITIPQWDATKCVECCHCSFVCSHAAIRPFVATVEEMQGAPESFTVKDAEGTSLPGWKFRIQVYPNQCLGCGSCANICPGKALTMKPIAEEMSIEEKNLAFAQAHISIKDDLLPRNTIQGSQLQQPLLEFSGACAACGETPYVKLLTQLFGERMIIANATGCSSIWGASMPSMPYTKDKNGHGPAWGNSLFEDNAEYGYGIAVAIQHRREKLELLVNAALLETDLPSEVKEALTSWNEYKEDPDKSYELGQNLLNVLHRQVLNVIFKDIINHGDLLGKKSVWCIGGDGWAYDIGYGGLDHVIASGQNIKILVLDTECYSNTGGQTSKATPLGATTKYSYAGKRTYKKDLGRIMMMYSDVYVASIALGADMQQSIDAFMEAENYDGPAIVIAYCPCINHGIRKGMGMDISEAKDAVACGYWPLYRYNPLLIKEGKNPLTIDYKAPNDKMAEFLDGEDRYADLKLRAPKEATILRPQLREKCDEIYQLLTNDIMVEKK